jgi:hypothetical protein
MASERVTLGGDPLHREAIGLLRTELLADEYDPATAWIYRHQIRERNGMTARDAYTAGKRKEVGS